MTPQYQILRGDNLELLRAMPDAGVDAIVTDPPYELTTGKRGASEQHRHRCEVRQLLAWRAEFGRAWVHAYINGGADGRGRHVKGVRQQRGDAAADKLLADCGEQFAAGNDGSPGVWLPPVVT